MVRPNSHLTADSMPRFPTHAVLSLLALAAVTAPIALTQQPAAHAIAGVWVGGTNAAGRWMFAEVRVSGDGTGRLSGRLDVASAQAAGIALDSLQLDRDRITFSANTPIGAMRFAGTWRDDVIDGSLSGGAHGAGLHLFRIAYVSTASTDSIAGVYDIDARQQMVLTPHASGMLSAFIIQHDSPKEAIGRNLFLLPTAADRYVSSASVVSAIKRDEQFTIKRDAANRVSAIIWHVPDGADRTLSRVASPKQQTVTIAGMAGRITGTMLTPDGTAPHAAVLLVGGGGATARDNLLLRAREFLKLNLAVLMLDKRGVAETDGEYFGSSLEQYADDAATALDWLRAQPGIDALRVGMHGHSQGGWVAPWAALKAQRPPAWLIITSGGPITPAEQETWRAYTQTRAMGATESEARAAEAFMRRKWRQGYGEGEWDEYLSAARTASTASWSAVVSPILSRDPSAWAFIAALKSFDPMRIAAQLRMPMLLLFGGKDDEQPAAISEARWRDAFARSGHTAFEIRTIPDGIHALWFGNGSPRPLLSAPTELIGAWLKAR